MKVEIVPAMAEHIIPIAERVRQSDRDELWALGCHTPLDALILSFKVSPLAWTGMIDKQPVCMFGVGPGAILTSTGRPWLIGTDLMDEYSMTFLRRCRGVVREMLTHYRHLENYVDVRNVRAITWLKWLKFKFDEPAPYGFLNQPFMRFTMERR